MKRKSDYQLDFEDMIRKIRRRLREKYERQIQGEVNEILPVLQAEYERAILGGKVLTLPELVKKAFPADKKLLALAESSQSE